MAREHRPNFIAISCLLWVGFFALLFAKGTIFPELSWMVVVLPLAVPFIFGLVLTVIVEVGRWKK